MILMFVQKPTFFLSEMLQLRPEKFSIQIMLGSHLYISRLHIKSAHVFSALVIENQVVSCYIIPKSSIFQDFQFSKLL